MEKVANGVHLLGNVPEMFQMFGPNGKTMTPVGEYKLDKGVYVHAYGAGMSEQLFVVVDDNMNACAVDRYSDNPDTWVNADWTRPVNLEEDKYLIGGYFSHRKHLQGRDVKPLSEKFGIGLYFDDVQNELADDKVIANAIAYCAFLDRVKAESERVAKEASEREHKRCETEYPHLTRIDNMGKDWKLIRRTTGNNMRAELKHHFPTTKFSVRYDSFSGGDEYRIEWLDGPTYEDVERVAKKFQLYHPDELSQGDYWDPVPSHFTNMYGDASYIVCERRISDEAIEKAKAKLLEFNPRLTDNNVNNMALPFSGHCKFDNLNEAARSYARELDFQEPIKEEPKKEKKTKAAKKIEPVSGEFKLIEYSEKAVVVVGDTKAVKDRLKALGGRFNGKLSCGAGWVFPKNKVEQLKQLLNL